MNETTQTPWKIDGGGDGGLEIWSPSSGFQDLIATVGALADAELLVRAVNSYDALLEACESIKMDLECNGECYGTDEARIEILTQAIEKAQPQGD